VTAEDYEASRVRPGAWGDGGWRLYDLEQRLQKIIHIYSREAEEKAVVPVADDSPWIATR